jgi:hypothetical protein
MPARAPSDQLNVRSQSILPIVGAAFVLCRESIVSFKSMEPTRSTTATTQNVPNVVYRVVSGWYSPRQTRPMQTKAAVRKEKSKRHAQGSAGSLSAPFLHAAYNPTRARNNTTAPARRTNIRLSRTGNPRPTALPNIPTINSPIWTSVGQGCAFSCSKVLNVGGLLGAHKRRLELPNYVPSRKNRAPWQRAPGRPSSVQTFASSALPRFPAQTRSLAA